ncbi:MAG: hypothetical protein JXD23_05300 [Spirochaetales bacterium]|nr:hypothetical protein [Spirochaetales bacterium]
MPLVFEVNDETLAYSLEVIPPMETIGRDQVGLLKAVIDKTAKVKQHSDATAGRYGKLIGQGRIGLLELFDELFISVVVLHERLKSGEPQRFAEFRNKYEFRVLLENRGNKFYSAGVLKDTDVALPNDFGSVYNDLVVEKIKKIVVLFKSLAPSGGVDELFEALDALLYAIIIIRYNIHRCTIDR